MLTQEERMDLRKRVLMGIPLSLEEARAVCETLRVAQGAAMAETKPKRSTRKKGITDEELNASLDDALGDL